MSRRVLLSGGPPDLRRRLAAEIDSGFDVVLEEAEDVLSALDRLPASNWDLFVVLSDGGRVPGLDLVRLLEAHAVHARVPVLFVGGDDGLRRAALAAGAERALSDGPDPGALSAAVVELLGVG